MNGEVLRKARIQQGYTQEELAELFHVSVATIQRWENGESDPYPRHRRQIHMILHIPMEDLMPESETRQSKRKSLDLFALQCLMPDNLTYRLECLTRHPNYSAFYIQQAITQVIEEYTRMHTNEYGALTRRDALQNLATFFALLSSRGTKLPPEETVKLCAGGITASGYLSRGNHEDMKLAYSILTDYIPTLKNVANTSSRHRPTAISLIAQALQTKAVLARHLESLKVGTRYAEQAVHFANMSDDIALQIMAKRELANSYRHNNYYDRALLVAEEIDEQLADMDEQERDEVIPPFLQSWVYAGFGSYSAHGHKSKKQQALTALAKARETFAVPLDEQNLPGFVNHCETNLINTEGIIYAALGEPDKGLAAFERIIDFEHDRLFAKLPTAQRTHVGSIIDATFISLKLPKQKKDKALSLKLWTAGIEGAKILHSEKFFHEAVTAYQIMESIWSDESDVQDLRDLIKKDWLA